MKIALIIFLVTALIALLAYYVYKESIGFHVVEYKIKDSKIKKNLKIVFLSDLHNNQHGKENYKLFDEIDAISPDYIMFGGDMITAYMEKWADYSDTIKFIAKLKNRYPVIYGMGNHEERLRREPEKFPYKAYEELSNTLEKIGTPILVNEKVKLSEYGIDVYGLDLDHAYYRKVKTRHVPDGYLLNTLGKVDEDKFNILIAHNPEHFPDYASWGADLVLSGHVHGGIIRLPFVGGVISPAMKLFPKYDGGLFDEFGSKMILSRGIGTHTIPIRVNNKAEVVVIELSGE